MAKSTPTPKPTAVHIATRLQCLLAVAHPDGRLTDRIPVFFELEQLDEESFREALQHFQAARDELQAQINTRTG